MRRKLTPHERRMVSALSGVYDATIRKWERGDRVQEVTERRIESVLEQATARSSEPPHAA